MRKYNFILMAFALLLGMAQCKKEPATPNGDNNGGVRITLKVDDDDNGEKLNVYPTTGAVIFTQGDKIYVGNNGKYVGTLTFDNGLFQGTIDSENCSTTDYLHFYFVGNKPTTPSTLAASTTTYTVNISDQSTGLPAISYAPSTAKYSPSTTAYTAKLLNKSALVKFVPSLATTQPITVSGLNNEVQIDFANHTLAPTGNTGGITLYSESESEKWAVLLEQASLSDLTVSVDGYNATIEGTTLPEGITNNMYYNSGIGISMTATSKIYEINSSNWQTTLSAFNAEPTANPTLKFTSNISWSYMNDVYPHAITRSDGIIDFDGHTVSNMFLQNNVAGESVTLRNGTIVGDGSNEIGIDSQNGWNAYYHGTIILENMTVNDGRVVFPDGHLLIIQSGTYWRILNATKGDCPGKVIINGGYFRENIGYSVGIGNGGSVLGTFELYGGKYAVRPDDAWCAPGYTIKSNQDDDKVTYPWVVCALPEGALRGEFTINGSGGKVFFSKGNLKYSNGTWSFHEQQYDRCFTSNGDVTSYYTSTGTFDLFGWGTSGWDNGNTYYRPWDTNNSSGGSYGPLGQYDLTGTYANADWGVYNPISNGGNQANQWRTLTQPEWTYIFNTRTTSSGIRYAKAQVNGVNGVILLPDDWSASYYSLSNTNQNDALFGSNEISSTQWSTLEQHGAVFLPAAGQRIGTSVGDVGSYGLYWSASYQYQYDNYAYYVSFSDSHLNPQNNYAYRYYGRSVRLVRSAQ